VSEIGQQIADLADHTSVLALNVSVQALRAAGMEGGDAAIGAAEVERLADRTVSATQRIAHLVNTIQRETTEVVSALETRATELSQWMEATSQADQVLQEIQQSAGQLTSLIHATSQAVAQQASSSAALTKAMDEMSVVTQQTTAWTKQAAASMSNLTLLAGSLHTSIHGERAA
jgi:twitching motility protein PilJ